MSMRGFTAGPNCVRRRVPSAPRGDVAQLGERCNRTAEVVGSNPIISTSITFTYYSSRRNSAITSIRPTMLSLRSSSRSAGIHHSVWYAAPTFSMGN